MSNKKIYNIAVIVNSPEKPSNYSFVRIQITKNLELDAITLVEVANKAYDNLSMDELVLTLRETIKKSVSSNPFLDRYTILSSIEAHSKIGIYTPTIGMTQEKQNELVVNYIELQDYIRVKNKAGIKLRTIKNGEGAYLDDSKEKIMWRLMYDSLPLPVLAIMIGINYVKKNNIALLVRQLNT